MPQYALLLYHDPSRRVDLSPEEMQKSLERYVEWANRPYTIDAKRLGGDAGRVIRVDNGKPRASDGPYSETKEVLGGFYLIQATNYDEAVQLALGHPHAQNGSIEIRQLWES